MYVSALAFIAPRVPIIEFIFNLYYTSIRHGDIYVSSSSISGRPSAKPAMKAISIISINKIKGLGSISHQYVLNIPCPCALRYSRLRANQCAIAFNTRLIPLANQSPIKCRIILTAIKTGLLITSHNNNMASTQRSTT